MKSNKRKTSFDIFIEERFADTKPSAKYGSLFLIICVLGAAFYFLVYMTVTEDLKKLDSSAEDTKKEIRQATNIADALEEKQQKLDTVKEEFTGMITAFPDQDQLPYLLATISEIGRGVGLDFKNFKPLPEEKVNKPDSTDPDFYTKTPLTIIIRGSYYSLIMFLDQISKLDRIVTIHDIDMDNPQLEGVEMILNTECQLVMYRYAEERKP